ncbi:poly(U)-specific 3'-to-5' RNA exonuclease [Coemansia sp. RSA 2320]|nr:poly(U)-specific 3'-to-5' RNA exonuclease [Coemansia sp. RSA 2320]
MSLAFLADYANSDDDSSEHKDIIGGNNISRSEDSNGGQGYCSDSSSTGEEDVGHGKGWWRGLVCLVIGQNSQLQELASACMDRLCTGTGGAQAAVKPRYVRVLGDLHISLTRPFYLQRHQLSEFARELESSVGGMGPIAVGFGGLSTYTNEQQTRGFVAVDVDHGEESIRRVLDRVNLVVKKFGKRRFYRSPRFHASLLAVKLAGDREMSEIWGSGLANEQERIAQLVAVRIDTVECMLGASKYSVALDRTD